MTNEELVALIQKGENVQDNMLKLYEQNRGYIYKFAKRYQRDSDIEDYL